MRTLSPQWPSLGSGSNLGLILKPVFLTTKYTSFSFLIKKKKKKPYKKQEDNKWTTSLGKCSFYTVQKDFASVACYLKKAWLLPALWGSYHLLNSWEKVEAQGSWTKPNQTEPKHSKTLEVTFKLLVQLWHNRGIRIDRKVKILRTTKTSSGLRHIPEMAYFNSVYLEFWHPITCGPPI